MMKKYNVTIDFESRSIEVVANSVEQAEERAIKRMNDDPELQVPEDYWVGEVDENDDVM